MGKRARRRKRSGEQPAHVAVGGLDPTSTVLDELRHADGQPVELTERQRELVVDAIERAADPVEKSEVPPPVRDLRGAKERLSELTMTHIEVVGTDDRERAIERERRAQLLGQSVRRLQMTPAGVPRALQRQLDEIDAELAETSPIEQAYGELQRRRRDVLEAIEAAGARRAEAFATYRDRSKEVLNARK